MTLEQLQKKRSELERQRKQSETSFHQITGAIAMLDEQIAGLRQSEVKVEEEPPKE